MKNVINKKVNGNVNNIDNSIKQTNNYFLTNITTNVGESGSSSGEAEMFGIGILALAVMAILVIFFNPVMDFLNNNINYVWSYLVVVSLVPLIYIVIKSGDYKIKNTIIAVVQIVVVVIANIINQNLHFPEELTNYLSQYSNGQLGADNFSNAFASYFSEGNSQLVVYLFLYSICYALSLLSPVAIAYGTFRFKKIPNILPWIAIIISLLFSFFGLKIIE
ncbi:hypothetical protein AB6M97_00220 [Streptococcus hillyeri]